MDRVAFREMLTEYFSADDLQTLCFDLDVDFDNLGGESKQAKARELVAHCERNSLIPQLAAAIRKARPNLLLQGEDQIGVVSMSLRGTKLIADEVIAAPDTYKPIAGVWGRTKPSLDEAIAAPAVARPINLSFETFGVGDWPSGWFNSLGFVDGVSSAYEAKVVARPDGGEGACVLFQNRYAREGEFGSLMQRTPARNLAGKAIRLEAEIRTWQVENWSGVWLRADGANTVNLVFDNMSRRPIRGSTPWKPYIIDAQLPKETAWLNYGLVLVGRGAMWADNFKLMLWTSDGRWVDV